jgi:hypothetical protein
MNAAPRGRFKEWKLTVLDAMQSELAPLFIAVAVVVIVGFWQSARYQALGAAQRRQFCETAYAKAKSATDTLLVDHQHLGDRGGLICGAIRHRVDPRGDE